MEGGKPIDFQFMIYFQCVEIKIGKATHLIIFWNPFCFNYTIGKNQKLLCIKIWCDLFKIRIIHFAQHHIWGPVVVPVNHKWSETHCRSKYLDRVNWTRQAIEESELTEGNKMAFPCEYLREIDGEKRLDEQRISAEYSL